VDYIFTFFAVFFLDVVYTYYLRCVAENKVFLASFWSVACYLGGSIAVINYTSDHWMLIPAMLGAFAGTWVGMKLKTRRSQDE
jgi:uncharacterized membrane protein YfcA